MTSSLVDRRTGIIRELVDAVRSFGQRPSRRAEGREGAFALAKFVRQKVVELAVGSADHECGRCVETHAACKAGELTAWLLDWQGAEYARTCLVGVAS